MRFSSLFTVNTTEDVFPSVSALFYEIWFYKAVSHPVSWRDTYITHICELFPIKGDMNWETKIPLIFPWSLYYKRNLYVSELKTLSLVYHCTRWARALPVSIFTMIQLRIDNWENKILIWWAQLPKELTGGDGYKYRFKPNALPWIFFFTRILNASDIE